MSYGGFVGRWVVCSGRRFPRKTSQRDAIVTRLPVRTKEDLCGFAEIFLSMCANSALLVL